MVLLADRFRRSQLDCGLAPCFGGRHASAQILFGLQRKMFSDLFLQALVRALTRRKIRQANQESSQESHARSSALILKKRAMMAEVCSHSRVSAWSCLRPAAVSR